MSYDCVLGPCTSHQLTVRPTQTTIDTHIHIANFAFPSNACLSCGRQPENIKTSHRSRKNSTQKRPWTLRGFKTRTFLLGLHHLAALKQNLCYDNYTLSTAQTQLSSRLRPSLTITAHSYWQLVKCCVQHSCWGESMPGQEGVWILASELWPLMLPNSFQRHRPGRDSDPLWARFVKMSTLIWIEGCMSFSPLLWFMQTRRVCLHLCQKVSELSANCGQTFWPPCASIPDLLFHQSFMLVIRFQD